MLLLPQVLELVLKHMHLPGELLNQGHVVLLDNLRSLVHLLRIFLIRFYHLLGMGKPGEDVSAVAHRPETKEGTHL